MQHRGEIIKDAVYKSGFPITELAKRLGKSRRWVYLLFENRAVSLDLILQIGHIIHVDFSQAIKEFSPLTTSQEPGTVYRLEEHEASYWKNKYLNLLEEYNSLLKKTSGAV
jgi:transcriptional regulator with XRE-family HTH domain